VPSGGSTRTAKPQDQGGKGLLYLVAGGCVLVAAVAIVGLGVSAPERHSDESPEQLTVQERRYRQQLKEELKKIEEHAAERAEEDAAESWPVYRERVLR